MGSPLLMESSTYLLVGRVNRLYRDVLCWLVELFLCCCEQVLMNLSGWGTEVHAIYFLFVFFVLIEVRIVSSTGEIFNNKIVISVVLLACY